MHKIISAMIVALLILSSTGAGLASSSMRLAQGGTCNLAGCRTQSDQCSAFCWQSTNTRVKATNSVRTDAAPSTYNALRLHVHNAIQEG